jgi:hypothetical protein
MGVEKLRVEVRPQRLTDKVRHMDFIPGRLSLLSDKRLFGIIASFDERAVLPAVREQEMPEKEWQAKAERLQACVFLLLEKNQTLRMALVAATASGQVERHW